MRRLLVAIDGSTPSERALSFAVETFPGDDVILLHVIDPASGVGAGVGGPGATEAWYESAKADGEALLADAAERAAAAGMSVETVVDTGRPAATIVACADERDVDHVVVGSHGRDGVSRLLLGSVAEAVMRGSPVPVTVVRNPDAATDDGTETDAGDTRDTQAAAQPPDAEDGVDEGA